MIEINHKKIHISYKKKKLLSIKRQTTFYSVELNKEQTNRVKGV